MTAHTNGNTRMKPTIRAARRTKAAPATQELFPTARFCGLPVSAFDGLSDGAKSLLERAYEAGGAALRDSVLHSLRDQQETAQAAAARALAAKLNPTRTETCE